MRAPMKNILRLTGVVALAALISGCHFYGPRHGVPGGHGHGIHGGPGFHGGPGPGYNAGPRPGFQGGPGPRRGPY